jgi:deaminated glutathione amidase
MRVSVVQMSPTADKTENIAQASRLIAGAVASERPDLVALPEIWTCLGGTRDQKFAAAEALPEPGDRGGAAYEFLRQAAVANGIHVHGGSIGELAGGRLFNTSLVFAPSGQELARYRKIHLFDITTPDGTGYRESETYGAGEEVVTCDIAGTKVGLAICYDVRFPELFLALRRRHVDLIMLPAAFTLQTGKDHWEVLLRARAIETQTYVLAAAQTGAYEAKGKTLHNYGHSMAIDPWGHVIARASDGVGIVSTRLDLALPAAVRSRMPVAQHRRLGRAADGMAIAAE